MKLNVPYYSQFTDIKDAKWKHRGCSITCLKMALEYFAPQRSPSIDDLISEGLLIGGYGEHGWVHSSLAILSHNYGVLAYAEEFRSLSVDLKNKNFSKSNFENLMLESGVQKIISVLKLGKLAMVSIPRGQKKDGTFHTVLIIGFELGLGGVVGFYFHDPDAENDKKDSQYISLNDFKKYWRKMAIIIG